MHQSLPMKNLVVWSLISLLTTLVWAQENPARISYVDCKILSQTAGTDTLFGVPVKCNKIRVAGTHKVQTFCNYGDPSAARYEQVKAEAEISVIPDSSGTIKDSLLSALKASIQRQEAYAASNGYAASVVPDFALFSLGGDTILAMPPFHSGAGNYGIWYIGGTVYKIKLTGGEQLASLKIFLRSNFKLTYKGAVLNPDAGKCSIDLLRSFLEQSR